MKRLHILGRKNHGKTTLLVELVEYFAAQGRRVGTIKHTHHEHELDVPGKDSFRHRAAGAAVAGILSRSMSAVFWPTPTESSADRYAQFEIHFAECEFVLVEGDTHATAPKIEVWRNAVGGEPLAASDSTILAVVADDPLVLAAPVWPRANIAVVAAEVLRSLEVAAF